MTDEYIRKADAIKQCGFGMTSLHIANNLRKIPPADVAPVVMCKDCLFFTTEKSCCRPEGLIKAREDAFCSYGERKE